MAADKIKRPCTVVLHDDRVSQEDVLCGSSVLPPGFLAYLSAAGARRLCIAPKNTARNPEDVSLHVSLAQRFGFQNRTKASVEIVEDYGNATATHAALSFREQHLSRADMWRIMQRLEDTVIYQGQKISYLGSVTAEIEAVYIAGQNVCSAYVTQTKTKPIFRSGSARFTLLIQVSKEMLENWVCGELMYDRLLNGYLSQLFQRWDQLKVRHQVSVVLFGRLLAPSVPSGTSYVGKETNAQDFFHVVVSDVTSISWQDIIRKIKWTFNSISLPRQVSLASEGNMLEAIHMAAMDFANDNLDPHLSSNGTSIIAITAGAGLFSTDHDMLEGTTYLLMGNSIGVDIVSLSPKPLHPAPLFSYKRGDIWEYGLPHWVDISFWEGHDNGFASRWLLPGSGCRLQDVALPLLSSKRSAQSAAGTEYPADYDDKIFGGTQKDATQSENLQPVASVDSKGTVRAPQGTGDIAERRERAEQVGAKSNSGGPRYIMQNSGTHDNQQGLLPKPPLVTRRKISLGPKGLAPSRGTASTSLTTEHVQLGKDPHYTSSFSPNESSSGIAKQLRQSLVRKPSQQSLASQSTAISAEYSMPIDIQNVLDVSSEPEDPTNVIEQNALETVSESELAEDGGLSETPKAKRDPFYAAVKAAEAEGTWETSPWLTLLNPINLKRGNMRVAAQYRQWQHVFPRAISSSDFKWTSMCSPAALPLTTEYRPSLRELERYPSKRIRRLLVPTLDNTPSPDVQIVLEQLILSRLSHGFQIAVNELSVADIDSSSKRERILVSLGNVYHELQCLSDVEIQIVEYRAESGASAKMNGNSGHINKYCAQIRGATTARTCSAQLLLKTARSEPDWARLDDQIISGTFSSAQSGCSRMRFVLIPVELPHTAASVRGLSDEERHLEGIQKLTQLWQRNRYFTADDQRRQVSFSRPRTTATAVEHDPNPLAIEYQTRDTSAMVNTYEPALAGHLNDGEPPALLFAESELYHSSNFNVDKLVRQIQEPLPRGIEVRDRRWLGQLHFKCFRGDEMVNWLMRAFKDLHSREEATAIGNELMSRGIFSHARHKHNFRDGNYFYQITSAHRTTDYPDTVSMFTKGSLRSVPSTPIAEWRGSPTTRAAQAQGDSNSSGRPTPTFGPQEKKKLLLSQMMLYNVDPLKKSDQLEVVGLHYDRIHNPENCYHIQLEWVNTTTKLIREAVGRWTTVAENYGLRLVQLPLAEACKLPLRHPFDQPVPVKMALTPPDRMLATPVLDPNSFSPRPVEDTLVFQKALLRKLEFVLDFEAAASFTTKLDITYSYGRPEYELTQFVHKSGLVLAQIAGDEKSDFLLMPNRLASSKFSNTCKFSETEDVAEIMGNLIKFCHDKAALKAFYKEANKPRMPPASPFVSGPITTSDSDIPPISLPPR